jgi:hypothetical protein
VKRTEGVAASLGYSKANKISERNRCDNFSFVPCFGYEEIFYETGLTREDFEKGLAKFGWKEENKLEIKGRMILGDLWVSKGHEYRYVDEKGKHWVFIYFSTEDLVGKRIYGGKEILGNFVEVLYWPNK